MSKVKYVLASLIAIMLSVHSFSQNEPVPEPKEANDTICTAVDVLAKFPGGSVAWSRYQERNFHFAFDSASTHFSGSAIIALFIVHKDGKLSDFAIKNPKEGRSKLEAAYLQLIKDGPNWIAAKKNGKNVTSRMTWSTTICLTEE